MIRKQIDICGDDGMRVKLGDICFFQSGGTPSKAKTEYYSGDIPWITTVALNGRKIDNSSAAEWITEKAICESAAKIVPAGSIMVGTRVGIGKVAINTVPMSTSQDIISLIGIDESRWNKEYVSKCIQSKELYLKSQARGATIKGIKIDTLAALDIPCLPISEQETVVRSLNAVDGIISARKKQLTVLDDLIKARFVEMFGTIHDNKFAYRIMTIQDVCEPIKDGTHQTPEYTDDAENGYKFLSSKDVTSGRIDWNHLKYIPEKLHKELYSRIAPRKGDLLLAKNGTTGIAAIVDRDEVFDIYVSLALLRPTIVDSIYLWGAINSTETKEQFDASLKGIGVPNLHLGEIKKTRIIVPPIEKQQEYATFVSQIDKSKSVIQKSLDETQLLFDSLMQKYFG